MAQLSYFLGTCQERLKKTTKDLSQDSPKTSLERLVVATLIITGAICCSMRNDRTTTPSEGRYSLPVSAVPVAVFPFLHYNASVPVRRSWPQWA
jgi:hypothetical protein